MCKQNLLNSFPFVWITAVEFLFFISFCRSLFFSAASQHNLLAPATMEITFHQFGNYRILINKIFPMELGLEWCFFLSFCHPPFFKALWMWAKDLICLPTDHLRTWWEHKPVAHARSISPSVPPPLQTPPKTLTSGVSAAQMGLFWYISQIEITSRLHKFIFGEYGHAFLHSN